jgi:peptide/nickel transport system substrate-binding protein
MQFRPWVAAAALVTAGALALAGCASGSTGAGDSVGSSDSGTASSQASSESSQGSDAPVSGGTLTLASINDVKSWDPSQAHFGHPAQYYQAVYDTLIRRSPDNEFLPMLATDWSYNDDNTVLTMTIRDDVTFSDGTKLDAAAVKENLDRFKSENGPDASFLRYVSDVAAPDATTVVLTLSEPDPSLIYALSNSASFIASPQAIAGGKLATDPVGSGPYVFDASASVPGSKYVFTKRDGYWDPSLQMYDKLVIQPMTDNTALLNALVSGQVDAGLVVSPKDAERAKSAGLTEQTYSVDWLGLMLFDRDGAIAPALKEVKVRQAINYAIDKQALLTQVARDQGELTSQILPPNVAGYDAALDTAYPYDPGKAKQLMAEAGYADGFDLVMPTVQGLADPALTAALTQNLGDIGITVTWDNVAITDFISDLVSGKYAAVQFQQAQSTAWYTTGVELSPKAVYNPFHTEDATVTGLIDTLQHGSQAEQDQAAADLNKYIVDQAWFAPFYRPYQLYFSDAKTDVTPQVQQAVPSIYNYKPKQ